MSRRRHLHRGISLIAAFSIALTTVSCGTILYPERRGQSGGKLDTTVVILDSIGLLFFFVPGVIAFAVDFATGAIYLPRFRFLENDISPDNLKNARMIMINSANPTLADIESVIEQDLAQDIDLLSPEVRVARATPDLPLVWDSMSKTLSPAQLTAFEAH